jgi:hypothetical protein
LGQASMGWEMVEDQMRYCSLDPDFFLLGFVQNDTYFRAGTSFLCQFCSG